jgi:hypothetical protein
MISREHSTIIKGILIFLIVLGHNHILCPIGTNFMKYLYEFHVVCFFVLPFFYERKASLSSKEVMNTVIRTWIPYLWMIILCYFVYGIYAKDFSLTFRHIQALITADKTYLGRYFGFVMPWFLPTFCSFTLLLGCARNYGLIYGGVMIWGIMNIFLPWKDFFVERQTVAFGLAYAVVYFVNGAVTYWIYRLGSWTKWLGLMGFIVLSVCYWKQIHIFYLYLLFPTCAFLSLLLIVPYVKGRLLSVLGKYSLGIYIIHLFISRIIEIAVPHTFFWGCFTLVVTLACSTLLIAFIYKMEGLRKLFFPKSLEELCSICRLTDKQKG